MQSELIAIPQDDWNAPVESSAPMAIALMALAIERRRSKRVSLPRESERYAIVCDRLGDIARELLEGGSAVRVWGGDAATTLRWVRLANELPHRAKKPPTAILRTGLHRARTTFVPPPLVAHVVAALEWLVRDVVDTWSDGPELLPLLNARLDSFRVAQARRAGTVEVLTF